MTEDQRRKLRIKKRRQKKWKRFFRKSMFTLAGLGIMAGLIAALFIFLAGNQGRSGIIDATPEPLRTASPMPAVTATPRPTLQIDPNAGELITPTPAPTEPGISIAGWSKIEIPAGVLEASVAINNPEDNTGWYYLTYELRLKETEEIVFATGLIPPGMYCNKVTLSRPFESGIYPASLHVQPYRMDAEQSPTNNADLELMLVVK